MVTSTFFFILFALLNKSLVFFVWINFCIGVQIIDQLTEMPKSVYRVGCILHYTAGNRCFMFNSSVENTGESKLWYQNNLDFHTMWMTSMIIALPHSLPKNNFFYFVYFTWK